MEPSPTRPAVFGCSDSSSSFKASGISAKQVSVRTKSTVKYGSLPSRLDVRLLRLPISSSRSPRVCARGVDRSTWRGTSVFTGERLAGRFEFRQQAKCDKSHAKCSLYCWGSAQPPELWGTEEQVAPDRSRKESDYSDLLGSL